MYIPCNLKFMKKRPEAVARSWWISQKIYFITFKSYISQQYFLVKTFFLNQSMTSQWPPKIVPIHTCHPVDKKSSLSNSIFQTRCFKILVQIDTAYVCTILAKDKKFNLKPNRALQIDYIQRITKNWMPQKRELWNLMWDPVIYSLFRNHFNLKTF